MAPILGAIAALTTQVSLASLESAITERFPEEVARITILGARLGYERFTKKEG